MINTEHIINVVLHPDIYLMQLSEYFGYWIYAILFLVIFCESGIIVTPFLPGESLLFTLGTLSARGVFSEDLLVFLLVTAAVLGGFVNYGVGRGLGKKLFFSNKESLSSQYIKRTHDFYERHGAATVLIARLVPIIRTYAPFVAGLVKMNFWRFLIYNILGGIAWIVFFIYISFYFGNIPIVKNNFVFVILGIIMVSVIPPMIEFWQHFRQRKKGKHANKTQYLDKKWQDSHF